MARRRLEQGGAAEPTRGGDKTAEPPDFVLPVDIDATAVAQAVREKLGLPAPIRNGAAALYPLSRRADGPVVLRTPLLRRLGGGSADKGCAVVRRLIQDVQLRGDFPRSK